MLEAWSVDFTIDTEGLRTIDPLPLVMPLVLQTSWLQPQHTIVHSIIAELFINALDHGILELDSAIKDTHDGFVAYQRLKQQRLQQLTTGSMRIKVAAIEASAASPSTGKLQIEIIDSGRGFAYQDVVKREPVNTALAGRGMFLLQTLGANLKYHAPGNHVEAIFTVG